MMIGWRAAFALGLSVATGACATDGRFLVHETQTFTTLSPTAVVVLYSPAAQGERAPEPCAGRDGMVPLPFISDRGAVPPVIRALAETGGDLLVFADCSLARGHVGAAAFETVRPKPCFARGAEPAGGYVELKTCRRLDDLKRLVQETKRNLPQERIFVAGSGVGAWAALLAARDPFRKFNAAIALDPAITGPGVPRNEIWNAAADRHRAWLASGTRIPALLIATPGAAGDGPTLAELTAIAPDLVLRSGTADPVAEAQAIRAYIDCRLQNPTAPCSTDAGEG
ncbi:MAG TPA: hypothetical protein VED46_01355 [Alphaproteobacteria bacterium]|nr:hypothetical protein [Alphaproteobacteria bacterium]